MAGKGIEVSKNEKTAGSSLTAIVEYTEAAAGLAELRQRHQGVVYDVTVAKEMKAAKEARAELRTLRTALERRRSEIKAPALERCRLIDAEAKRLTAEIRSMEDPIDVQIKAEEARKQAEELARFEAERQRVEAIGRAIEGIRNVPSTLIGKPAIIIEGQLAKLEAEKLDPEFFAERMREAQDALVATIAHVGGMLQLQRDAEAEQKRIAAERAELERLRAEAEERRKADEARAAAERAETDRQAQAERDRLAAEQLAREEAERAERERKEAEARAAREAQERAEREVREAELAAERERQAAEQRRLDEERAKLERERKTAAEKAEHDRLASLGLREAAQAVVNYFQGEEFEALGLAVPKCVFDLDTVLNSEARARRPKRSAAA